MTISGIGASAGPAAALQHHRKQSAIDSSISSFLSQITPAAAPKASNSSQATSASSQAQKSLSALLGGLATSGKANAGSST